MENKKSKLIIWVLRNKALIYLGGMLLLYSPIFLFTHKFGFGISDKIEAWKNTAEIFNNFYTPVLSFIAGVLILYTYLNQRKSNSITNSANLISLYRDLINLQLNLLENGIILHNEIEVRTIKNPNIKTKIILPSLSNKLDFSDWFSLNEGIYFLMDRIQNFFILKNNLKDVKIDPLARVLIKDNLNLLQTQLYNYRHYFFNLGIICNDKKSVFVETLEEKEISNIFFNANQIVSALDKSID